MPANVDTPPVERAEPPSADPPRIMVWHVWHPATDDASLNRVIIPQANEKPLDGAVAQARSTAR
jgi:hypothetical protein